MHSQMTLQNVLLKAVDHLKSPSLWCEVCDTFAHSPADFKVTISVLIGFPFYVWYNCRYIGLFDYADLLGYLILSNPLNDHWQTYHLYYTYATCSPFNGLFFAHLCFNLIMLLHSVLINLSDVLTKTLGWFLHPFHTCRTLEHYPSFIIYILLFIWLVHIYFHCSSIEDQGGCCTTYESYIHT